MLLFQGEHLLETCTAPHRPFSQRRFGAHFAQALGITGLDCAVRLPYCVDISPLALISRRTRSQSEEI
jgi:hypothetical protein